MALYEGNFIKLVAMAPALGNSGAHLPHHSAGRSAGHSAAAAMSRSGRDLDLHLCVDAVTRYTIDLRLTYLFDDDGSLAPDPDLHLRVYLDARMVEVISWSVSHRHEVLRELAATSSRELDRRWSRNIMLGKWLDYLHDMGHSFPA